MGGSWPSGRGRPTGVKAGEIDDQASRETRKAPRPEPGGSGQGWPRLRQAADLRREWELQPQGREAFGVFRGERPDPVEVC